VESRKVRGNWSISPTDANHVAYSANPGTPGNIIVFGHNTRNVFGKLRSVRPGTRILVTTGDGILYQYTVVSTDSVPTDKTDLLKPRAVETLTLYTCTGWMDSERFVVRAVPVSS
jgi:LPXTG-site transpeptidase (sortase) family protein